MALILADRVQETTTSTGTGSVTLNGAVTGYQTFAVIGNGNTCYYTIADQGGSNWEVGIGTYSTTGPTLARTTVLSNSDGNTSPVNFPAGVKTVFVTYPSEKSVNLDSSGNVSALGTVSSGTWQGSTVGVAYGGTGVTSSSGANSVVLRDANANVTFNNFTAGATAVTAAGGTTVLTVGSARTQILVGSTTQTFQLPDATTLQLGQSFIFVNNSSGALTVVDNASTTIETVPSGGITQLGAVSIATSAGSWGAYSFIPAVVNWGTNSLALASTVISGGTWQGGTIQSGYGGTGLTTFTGANNALYSTSSSALTAGTLPVAAGGTGQTTYTDGQLLIGNSTGNTLTKATLTPGTGISVTNSAGGITITNTSPSSGGTVTSVTATAPVASTGGTTPVISMPAATTSVDGYLTSTDWNTFNGKANAFTYTTGYIPFGQGTTTPNQSSSLTYASSTLTAPIVSASNGLVVNSNTVSASYSIPSGSSASSVGPMTVASGQSVTVGSGSRWVVL